MKMRELWSNSSWILHYGCTPTHTAYKGQILVYKSSATLNHSVYCTDLVPCDLF